MKVISLGVGVQSTALYYMSSMGQMPRADVAIFADPGAETDETYKYLEYLKQWQIKNYGIEIIHCGKKSIWNDLIHGTNSTGQRFASIPAFTWDGESHDRHKGKVIGMIRRQCTTEYKIEEVNKAIRKIWGLKKHQRTPETEIWIGITTDEASRMDSPKVNWQIRVYPFLGYALNKKYNTKINLLRRRYSRIDVYKWYEKNNLPIPPKSACKFCPFQDDLRWIALKKNKPKEFEEICKFDEKIRDSSKHGVEEKIYLHRSCLPLREVKFDENQEDLFNSECKGYCGI